MGVSSISHIDRSSMSSMKSEAVDQQTHRIVQLALKIWQAVKSWFQRLFHLNTSQAASSPDLSTHTVQHQKPRRASRVQPPRSAKTKAQEKAAAERQAAADKKAAAKARRDARAAAKAENADASAAAETKPLTDKQVRTLMQRIVSYVEENLGEVVATVGAAQVPLFIWGHFVSHLQGAVYFSADPSRFIDEFDKTQLGTFYSAMDAVRQEYSTMPDGVQIGLSGAVLPDGVVAGTCANPDLVTPDFLDFWRSQIAHQPGSDAVKADVADLIDLAKDGLELEQELTQRAPKLATLINAITGKNTFYTDPAAAEQAGSWFTAPTDRQVIPYAERYQMLKENLEWGHLKEAWDNYQFSIPTNGNAFKLAAAAGAGGYIGYHLTKWTYNKARERGHHPVVAGTCAGVVGTTAAAGVSYAGYDVVGPSIQQAVNHAAKTTGQMLYDGGVASVVTAANLARGFLSHRIAGFVSGAASNVTYMGTYAVTGGSQCLANVASTSADLLTYGCAMSALSGNSMQATIVGRSSALATQLAVQKLVGKGLLSRTAGSMLAISAQVGSMMLYDWFLVETMDASMDASSSD